MAQVKKSNSLAQMMGPGYDYSGNQGYTPGYQMPNYQGQGYSGGQNYQSQSYPMAPNQGYQTYLPMRGQQMRGGGFFSPNSSLIIGITIILVWALLIMAILGLARWTFGKRN
ncbi:MAG: hypothetical protein P4L58_04755 [Candidatus Pacebacteria bacterium]|nr:hypothetical protein [Candidatus Paceibacterota bacterium]